MAPSSLVIKEIQPKGQQSNNAASSNREGRKLDVISCKIYSFISLGLRVAKYQTIMAGLP